MIRRRNAGFSVVIGLMAAGMAGTALAADTASATIAGISLGGGEFQYNIALTNTSTDGSVIGTFWYAWVPGADFMQVQPTNITQPSGWSANITGSNNSSDGNAIQWIAGAGDALAQGHTDDFSFESTESLAQLEANSPFGPKDVENTSVTYEGAPFSAGENIFVVPEPVSASVMAICGAGLLLRRRRNA
ncbi:MAG TPA: hypothetical protein VHX86_00695 [Tepidisphaeraceae bacterium]|jgi:hypothetical protein|nr:hypothetical protein [Tepidisphaeraceae bacterium]